MITVITGTPGAGKTLYAIEKLLLPLLGKTVKGRADDGSEVEYPRTIYTNINGLLIDHELINGSDNQGLQDWHKWAKPGSVIVFDEVQKVWPPRANGSKVPDHVQELDTHRHKGVDFILITQSVMNVDRHIHALGGRHLHVRRVGNMKAAVVYEWDHVSKSLMYSKSISKSPWRYSSKVFKLYKSSELHTKQPRKVPTLIWFVLMGVITLMAGGPMYFERMKSRLNPDVQAQNVANQKPAKSEIGGSEPKQADTVPVVAVVSAAEPEKPLPKLVGCVRSKARCSCYDDAGQVMAAALGHCEATTATPAILLAGGTFPENPVYYPPSTPAFDGSVGLPGPMRLGDIVRRGHYQH